MYRDLFSPVEAAFAGIWVDTMSLLPMLLVALLLVVVGWIVGNILKRLVIKLFTALKVNEALDAAGVDVLAKRSGYELKAGVFVGTLVKWFAFAVFFVAALDVLGLTQVTEFVREVVLGYLPNVIVAVLILLVASLVANAAATTVTAGMRTARVDQPEVFGKITYYAIILFALLAVLNQLKIAPELVQMLFAGMVFAFSLALGLSFGLGGRDTASKYLERLTKNDQ